MELTEEQKKAVAGWVADGENIAAVQKKISNEYGIAMTYMEVRFLLDDMGAAIKDKETPTAAVTDLDIAPGGGVSGMADGSGLGRGMGSGGVSVDVDRVVKAGAVVSGTVTFSDGTHAGWMLDAMGRLDLTADKEGYSPSEGDLRAFQAELSKQLKQKGF